MSRFKSIIPLILFTLLLVTESTIAQKKPDYKNLVLEGGGIRGIAYAGVLTVLAEKGVLQEIENVGGSSAGSIIALLVSIGYTTGEIDSVMRRFRAEKLNDGKGGLYGKFIRLKKMFGIYKGDAFEKWLRQLVYVKTGNPDLTFQQLHQLHLQDTRYRDLYCTGTNLSKQEVQVFSRENSPNMPLALAVRASCSIPFYFQPVLLNNQFQKIARSDTSCFVNYYADGAMLFNYPINMFDTCEGTGSNPLTCEKVRFNQHTLGIKLERLEQIDSFKHNTVRVPPYAIHTLADYANAFGNLMIETISRRYPNLENEKGRTIYISQGNISPRLKKTKMQARLELYNNGIQAAREFLSK